MSVQEEEVIVAFRRYTLLPLDDCFYALQPTSRQTIRAAARVVHFPHDRDYSTVTDLARLRG